MDLRGFVLAAGSTQAGAEFAEVMADVIAHLEERVIHLEKQISDMEDEHGKRIGALEDALRDAEARKKVAK